VDPSSPGVAVAQQQTDQAASANAQAQAMQSQAQAQQQALNQQKLEQQARESRADRVKTFLNFCIFYRMEAWEDDTDQLLTDLPILGCGFKKTYVSDTGLQSDYVSPMHFTVHRDTKSLNKCPRMTQDYEIYPNEIDEGQRTGRFRPDVVLAHVGSDPDQPRTFLEQHRLEDLDGDGLREPYIVTVDEQTMQVMRIEPAFTADGVKIDERRVITRIERWQAYSAFKFMPHPRGWFYGIGFGKLLAPISDSVDSSINQLIDAGNAAIAGGGFIGSQVRIQGSAAGGALFMQPGEYQVVATSGPDLRSAIYERTTPNVSPVTFQMLEMLIGAGKDIASIKDVASGDTPTTAPVGTTLAVMNQALQGFTAIWARVYRGFTQEFANMYDCVKRFADDNLRQLYAEVTGGDLDQDFAGDGTDIRPVADPRTVTKMQKVAKAQGLAQVAESPVGQAAGMTQPGPAQEIVREMLDVLDIDRPERFFANAPPNPIEMAKAQSDAAAAQLKQAQAQSAQASAQLSQAKTVREMGLAAIDSHDLAKEGDRINRTGSIADTPKDPDAAQMQGAGPGAEMPPPSSAP
jgi:chaperonin GroES